VPFLPLVLLLVLLHPLLPSSLRVVEARLSCLRYYEENIGERREGGEKGGKDGGRDVPVLLLPPLAS